MLVHEVVFYQLQLYFLSKPGALNSSHRAIYLSYLKILARQWVTEYDAGTIFSGKSRTLVDSSVRLYHWLYCQNVFIQSSRHFNKICSA